MRSIFFVLGNQLFDIKYLKNYKNCDFFMSEDYSLCTYEKHHKLKILHTLSSMRSYYDLLKNKHFKIHYYSHENKFTESYENKLKILIKKIKAKKVYSFEIEDKPFELSLLTSGILCLSSQFPEVEVDSCPRILPPFPYLLTVEN